MPHPYADIPEFGLLDVGGSLVRIPTHQDVPFSPRVRALVDTAEFQRLARISQLGLASRVYPGATHTRFEHALGVFHNAMRYLWQLGKDPRFADVIGPHEAEVLLVAALLHDLGHWPFCHPIEDMKLAKLPSHEQLASRFLRNDGPLAEILDTRWKLDPADVLDVLVARTDTPKSRLLRSILSGPIDIDKMDYLERDSLHAGVPYGNNYDRNRLIQSLLLNETGDGLAITSKGRTAAELMVFARYVMFSEVYWHHAVRSATCMFARGFYELHDRLDLDELVRLGEPQFIDSLRHTATGTIAEPLFDGIFGPLRTLHKGIAEYSLYQQPEIYQRLARQPYEFLVSVSRRLQVEIGNALQRDVGEEAVLLDAPPPHREIEFHVPIYFAKEKVYRDLHHVSPVVETLARKQFDDYVKRVRVFVAPDLAPAIIKDGRLDEWLITAIEAS